MIVVTGANGKMGTELAKTLDFIPMRHSEVDITKYDEVARFMDKHQPDLVVHLAALSGVELGETAHNDYYLVNVVGTRNVADNCANMVYMSTEYVFDGTKGDYTEYDAPNPINYYGLSKLLGEAEARRAGRSVVIRTAMKPRPFKHAVVPRGMYTTGHYLDEMVKEYQLAIENFWDLPETVHIGLDKISMFDLASQTRKVKEEEPGEFMRLPLDASLETSLWKRIKRRIDGTDKTK